MCVVPAPKRNRHCERNATGVKRGNHLMPGSAPVGVIPDLSAVFLAESFYRESSLPAV